jgi:hypothetical protein
MRVLARLHSVLFLSASSGSRSNIYSSKRAAARKVATIMTATTTTTPWKANDPEQVEEARKLGVWPLDESNAGLLNEVHPRNYDMSCDEPHEVYDLIAIGAGAGGLVSSRQVR